MKSNQDLHKWETNAAERQIGEHTRHYIEILGRLEDTCSELFELVESTGIVGSSGFDSYVNPTMEHFCAFRTEVRKLMFENITENLNGIGSKI